jgi:hypothetical protein
MGLTRASWSFRGRTPAIEEIVARLRLSTGLPLPLTFDGTDIVVSFDPLNERLFEWEVGEYSITSHGFVPAHPYVWSHLNRAMVALGGRLDDARPGWRPQPRYSKFHLEVPWQSLTRAERLVLRLPFHVREVCLRLVARKRA